MSAVAIAETWKDTQNLVYRVVLKFQRRFGGDVDELVGEAKIHFMVAYKTFDPNRAKLSTHLWHNIYNGLRVHARSQRAIQRGGKHRRADGYDLGLVPSAAKQAHWSEELTPDAKHVAELVLDPPPDIRLMLSDRKRPGQQQWREVVADYLRDMGWCNRRVLKAFVELRRALCA